MKAQNRKEIFLKALANGEEPKIKPLTREEALLAKQAKRESSGGGGGGGSDFFVIKADFENMKTITPMGDILDAHADNKALMLIIDSMPIFCTTVSYADDSITVTDFVFTACVAAGNMLTNMTITLSVDGSLAVNQSAYQLTPLS